MFFANYLKAIVFLNILFRLFFSKQAFPSNLKLFGFYLLELKHKVLWKLLNKMIQLFFNENTIVNFYKRINFNSSFSNSHLQFIDPCLFQTLPLNSLFLI